MATETPAKTTRKTPAKAAAKKAAPGPKPKCLVVEDSLKCQTDVGEISLSLRLPLDSIMGMIGVAELGEEKIPGYLMDNIVPADVAKKLRSLPDGVEAIMILMAYFDAVAERLGASLGKLRGSSD